MVVDKTVDVVGKAATEAPVTPPEAGQDGGRRRKGRKTKRKSGGKRKLNPFMKFANTKRAALMKANPGKAVSEIGKMLGAGWRGLSDVQKAAFK